MPTHIPHWIEGARREGASGRTGDVTDSATGEVIGEVPLASTEEVDAAVAAASAAFPGWRDTSLAKRTAIMFKMRELVLANQDELAKAIVNEHGKDYNDAIGEIQRGRESTCATLRGVFFKVSEKPLRRSRSRFGATCVSVVISSAS